MTNDLQVTVFANFYIDTDERLQRMKNSLLSMKTIECSMYVVNARGRFADQALKFIKDNTVNSKLFNLESTTGWFYDTSKLLPLIEGSYVLFWLEDHICMAPDKINAVVEEMNEINADILTYSFWQDGKFNLRYENVPQIDGDLIKHFIHSADNNFLVQNSSAGNSFLITCVSILKKSLFQSIILEGHGESKWPKNTPFAFEKQPNDLKWLPLTRANPKQELFASIDDDLGVPGSSLQSRGLYGIDAEIIERHHSYAASTSIVNRIKKNIRSITLSMKAMVAAFKIIFIIKGEYRLDYLGSFISLGISKKIMPWMNYEVVSYLTKNLHKIDRVFEYGSGESTKYWALNNKKIDTVEHDPHFYNKLKALNLEGLNLKLIEPHIIERVSFGENSQQENYLSEDFIGYSFEDYVREIDSYPENYFDIVLIDGRARSACIKHSVSKVKPGGMLLLDNANRVEYLKDTATILDKWSCKKFIGFVRGLAHQEHTIIYTKPT